MAYLVIPYLNIIAIVAISNLINKTFLFFDYVDLDMDCA